MRFDYQNQSKEFIWNCYQIIGVDTDVVLSMDLLIFFLNVIL